MKRGARPAERAVGAEAVAEILAEVDRALLEIGLAELGVGRAAPVDVVEDEEVGLAGGVDMGLADLGVGPADQLL